MIVAKKAGGGGGGGGGEVVLKPLFQLSSRGLAAALAHEASANPHPWESLWHAEVAVRPVPWMVVQPASWPSSVRLRGKGSVFHRLHVPGLLDAYQRDLLLWVYLRRVWTNERCHRVLQRGDPGCLVCGGASECLRHLVWDCPAVREAWKMVICLFADLRGLARPNLSAPDAWSHGRFVVSLLGRTPEWPVSAVPASESQALIWLVLKAELLSCVWRMRCKLIHVGPGPAPAAVVHTGVQVVQLLQAVLRARVLEERCLATDGLKFEDWVERGALGRVDGGLGGAISFSPLMGAVSRWLTELEDPLAPDHLFAGLPVIRRGGR